MIGFIVLKVLIDVLNKVLEVCGRVFCILWMGVNNFYFWVWFVVWFYWVLIYIWGINVIFEWVRVWYRVWIFFEDELDFGICFWGGRRWGWMIEIVCDWEGSVVCGWEGGNDFDVWYLVLMMGLGVFGVYFWFVWSWC